MPKLLPRLRSTSFNPGPRNVLRPRSPALAQAMQAPCALTRVHAEIGKSAALNHPPLTKSDRLACFELPKAGVKGTSKLLPSPLRSSPARTQNGYPSWKLPMTPNCQFPNAALANRFPKMFLGTSYTRLSESLFAISNAARPRWALISFASTSGDPRLARPVPVASWTLIVLPKVNEVLKVYPRLNRLLSETVPPL